jgi:hypothetical protein
MPTDTTLKPVNFTPEQEIYLDQMREKVVSSVKPSDDQPDRKRHFDQRRFEEGCKRHSPEEKSRLVLVWCKKMINEWQKDFT